MAYKGDSRSWETSLGWPTELHGHAVECERGQYLSHDTETGMFDGEASAEYILGLTQFPSRYGHPSVDALATKVSHGTQTSKENKPTSIFCGKIFHLSSFPCCVVKYRDLSLRRQFCHATPISYVSPTRETTRKGREGRRRTRGWRGKDARATIFFLSDLLCHRDFLPISVHEKSAGLVRAEIEVSVVRAHDFGVLLTPFGFSGDLDDEVGLFVDLRRGGRGLEGLGGVCA